MCQQRCQRRQYMPKRPQMQSRQSKAAKAHVMNAIWFIDMEMLTQSVSHA